MSLDWQKVHIALAKGMQQAADERALEPPSLAVAKNARFTELGGIQKRHSYSAITGEAIPAGTEVPIRVLEYDGQLLALTEDKIYSYSAAEDAWKNVADYEAISVEETTTAARREDQYHTSQAVVGGVRVVTWINGPGNPAWLAAYDEETGTLLAGPYEQTGIQTPILLPLTSRIVFLGWDGTDVVYKMMLPSNIDSATANEGLRGSTTTIAGAFLGRFTACSRGNTFVVLHESAGAGGGVVLRKYTDSGSGAPSLDYNVAHAALAVANSMAVALAPDGQIAAVRAANPAVADIFNADCTAASTGVTVGNTMTVPASRTTLAFNEDLSGGEYVAHYFGSYSATAGSVVIADTEHNTINTAGTAGTPEYVHDNIQLGSAAFAAQIGTESRVYVWVLFDRPSDTSAGSLAGGFKAALQNTYFLIRASDLMPVAKAAPTYAAAAIDNFVPPVQVTNFVEPHATIPVTRFLGTIRRRVSLGEEGSTGYEEASPVEIKATLNTSAGRRAIQLGKTLYLTGGFVSQFDGVDCTELGFDVYPFEIGVSATTGTLAGTFVYKLGWRWNNARGEVDRSTTATYCEDTLSTQAGDLAFREWLCSRKNTNYGSKYPAVEVWRTIDSAPVGANFYLASSLDPSVAYPTANSYVEIDGTGTRAAGATFTDNLADSALTSRQIDPFQDQLEPVAPPPATIITATQDRLVLAGIPGKPYTVQYSRLRGDGEVASFNEALAVDVPPDGGKITSLAVLNETIVVFCERSIYMLPGSGFDNVGGGQNYGPARLLSNDVGAQYDETVAVLPDGVIFRSDKGWHILDRSWQVNFIGAPVENYDTDTIVGVHVMPKAHQVRITSTSRVLVWDTRANQWSEWEISGALGACVWDGKHVIATPTQVLVDDEDYSNVDYALDIETAWIKLDGLQGFSRARFLRVLGEYRSAHALRVRVARNYRKSGGDWAWDDDKDWTATADEAGDALRVRHRLSKQKCEAIKVRLTDKYVPTGDGEPSVLESGSDATNQTSYSTSAFTPGANTVIYAAIATAAGSAPNTPTLSGHGTWVEVGSVSFDSSRKVSLFRTKTGSAPSSSAVTFDFAGQTQFHGVWAILAPQNPVLTGTNGADSIGNTDTDSATAPNSALSTSLATLDSSTTSGHLAVVYHGSGTNATASGFVEVVNEAVTSPNMELTVLWATGTAAAAITTNTGSPGSAVVSAEVKRATAPSGESLKLTGLSLEYGVKSGLGQLPATNKQ